MAIYKSLFGTAPNGAEVYEYVLENANGAKLQVLTYGLRIHKLFMPDKNGELKDVVLGYDKLEQYFGMDFQGTFVGRYANRIGNAEFELDGVIYKLDKNDGVNTLHGGRGGYHQVVWDAAGTEDGENPSITFSHVSPDMDEGYPGKLELEVTYTLTADNAVKLSYKAKSDKKTVFNPTNHSFFNLSGDHTKDVLDTWVKIYAENYTPVGAGLIPTGEILPVEGTPVDFRAGKLLSKDMFADDPMIIENAGFDHNFCVDGEGMRLHAEAHNPVSGIFMQVYSDMPGIQLYTFNKASGAPAKNGAVMLDHGALCLETQFYPDSPNQKNFPFDYVTPEKPFSSETVYKFSVK